MKGLIEKQHLGLQPLSSISNPCLRTKANANAGVDENERRVLPPTRAETVPELIHKSPVSQVQIHVMAM